MTTRFRNFWRATITTKNLKTSPFPRLIGLWLVWSIILFSFQAVVLLRFRPVRPDNSLAWVKEYTQTPIKIQKNPKTNLLLLDHVGWDSHYYLSIAIHGYHDYRMERITDPKTNAAYSMNYAFFPLYPMLIRGLVLPFWHSSLSLEKIAIIAGILISLVGTLLGMISLYFLIQDRFGPEIAYNASFYMLIFPSAIFLGQVYSDALFIGLSFFCILLLSWRRFYPAVIVWSAGYVDPPKWNYYWLSSLVSIYSRMR